MATTNYNIDAIRSMAILKGDAYKDLNSELVQQTNVQARLAQLQTNITTLRTRLRTLQVQVLAALSPPVVVGPSTPINMSVNQDGTVTLVVG